MRLAFLSLILVSLGSAHHLTAQKLDSAATIENNLLTEKTPKRLADEIEIGQLVLDQTFSKAGSDFQQLFNTNWVWPPQNAEQFIISIVERPTMGNSTIVELTINDYKVFESFLQPRYDLLEEISLEAIRVLTEYMMNYEEFMKQMNGEEMSGTGIY